MKFKNKVNIKKTFKNLDIDELWMKYEEQIKKSRSKKKNVNIMVMENTESDRKNLLNNIIRDDNLTELMSKPINNHSKKITRYKYPMTFFCVPTFKYENAVTTKEYLTITKENSIHCIWYCIDISSGDVSLEEIKSLKNLFNDSIKNVPVICILTQANTQKDIKKVTKKLEKENVRLSCILPIFIKDEKVNLSKKGLFKKSPTYGVKKVAEKTIDLLGDENKDAFLNIQAYTDLKKKAGEKRIRKCLQSSLTEILTPSRIPDSVILFPLQINMLEDLAYLMGIDLNEDLIKGFIFCTIGANAAEKNGKKLFSVLSKHFPAGLAVEKGIRVATALLVTYTLGEVFMQILTLIYKGERSVEYYSTPEGMDEIHKRYKKSKKANNNMKFLSKSKNEPLLLEMKNK